MGYATPQTTTGYNLSADILYLDEDEVSRPLGTMVCVYRTIKITEFINQYSKFNISVDLKGDAYPTAAQFSLRVGLEPGFAPYFLPGTQISYLTTGNAAYTTLTDSISGSDLLGYLDIAYCIAGSNQHAAVYMKNFKIMGIKSPFLRSS